MTNVEPPPGPRRRRFRTGRLEAFSDGVFAIAITLLVLDIAVSQNAGKNLLLLLVVSFLPFPTRLFADYIGQVRAERVAVMIYGTSLLLASVLLLVLWRYAVREGLVRPDAADEEIQLLTQRLTPGLASYLVLLAAGLFVPILAVIGYLAIAVYYIIPFRNLSAGLHLRRRRPPPAP